MTNIQRKIMLILAARRDMSGGFISISKQALREKLDSGLDTTILVRDLTTALEEMATVGFVTSDTFDLDGLEETVFSATAAGAIEMAAPFRESSVGVKPADKRMDELKQRLFVLRGGK